MHIYVLSGSPRSRRHPPPHDSEMEFLTGHEVTNWIACLCCPLIHPQRWPTKNSTTRLNNFLFFYRGGESFSRKLTSISVNFLKLEDEAQLVFSATGTCQSRRDP